MFDPRARSCKTYIILTYTTYRTYIRIYTYIRTYVQFRQVVIIKENCNSFVRITIVYANNLIFKSNNYLFTCTLCCVEYSIYMILDLRSSTTGGGTASFRSSVGFLLRSIKLECPILFSSYDRILFSLDYQDRYFKG